jgi:hypothetical protein
MSLLTCAKVCCDTAFHNDQARTALPAEHSSSCHYVTARIYQPLEVGSKKEHPTIKMSIQESIGEKTPAMANKRPATMSELRKCITHGLCDNSQPFKSSLKQAGQSRREGEQYSDTDLERAFVAFALASYLVLVKLPMHPHYKLLSSDEQRRNMLHVGYFDLFYYSPIDNIQEWSGYSTNAHCLEAKDRRSPNRMGHRGCIPQISCFRHFPSVFSHEYRHYTTCAGHF